MLPSPPVTALWSKVTCNSQEQSEAFAVRKGVTEIMEAYGLAHLGERRPEVDPMRSGPTTRVMELVCIGAAFGVNCVLTLKTHLDAAESVGISPREIAVVAKLSAFINGNAASHVEHLVESLDKPEAAYEKAVTACCGSLRQRQSAYAAMWPMPQTPICRTRRESACTLHCGRAGDESSESGPSRRRFHGGYQTILAVVRAGRGRLPA